MTECIPPGYITANGACAFLAAVNTHGAILTDCGDVAYIPAACPDVANEGAVSLGPVEVKIASVDGTVADVCVQRDANGAAWASQFGVDAAACDNLGTLVQEKYVTVGNGDSANDPGGAAVASALRLRGRGDIPAYGGVDTEINSSVFELRRYGSRQGIVEYCNIGGPDEGTGSHVFKIEDWFSAYSQTLMVLDPAGGGSLYFPAWNYVSDVRLKTNVTPIAPSAALAKIQAIEPITYTYNNKNYTGFSAQNVATVLPEAVSQNAEGTYTMRDGDVLATLVAAVKALTARVEELEAK